MVFARVLSADAKHYIMHSCFGHFPFMHIFLCWIGAISKSYSSRCNCKRRERENHSISAESEGTDLD